MTYMHRFSALLVVLVTLATSPQLFAAPRIEDVLPADTSLLLMVEDMPALLEQGSENPLVAVWNHERVRTVLATTRRVIKVDYLDGLLEMGLGYPLKDVLADLPGQAALAVPKLQGGLGESPSFGLMARVEDPQRVKDVMDFLLEFAAQRAPEGVQLNNVDEEYIGEVLHLQQIVQDKDVSEGLGWAIVNGMAVIAQPKAYLQELVASIKQGEAESPWSQTDAYQRVRSWAPESDLLLYVNGDGFSHLVKSYLGVGETAEQVEDQEPQVVTLSTIVSELSDVLHVDNIDGLYLAGSLRAEVTVLEINLLYHENNGLLRLLAYEPGPVTLPDFVPDDATNVTVSLFSLPAVWTALKETAEQMKTLERPYARLQAQLQGVSQQAGFDVEKALLSSMGDEVVTWPR